MPEHDLPILGETEIALERIGSILLHGTLKRRHGVLDCETGGATMANHQEWRGGVTPCSPSLIATYHRQEPLRDELEIIGHNANDDSHAPGYPTRPLLHPYARRCTDPSDSPKYPAGHCVGETGPRR